jgi:hypothetical protein
LTLLASSDAIHVMAAASSSGDAPALDHLVLVDDSLTVDLAILATMLVAAVVLVVATRGRPGFDHRPGGTAVGPVS